MPTSADLQAIRAAIRLAIPGAIPSALTSARLQTMTKNSGFIPSNKQIMPPSLEKLLVIEQ